LCYVAVELSNNNAEVDISVLQSGEATAEETISVAEVSSTDQIDKPNCAVLLVFRKWLWQSAQNSKSILN
jgi:hypothetical protein